MTSYFERLEATASRLEMYKLLGELFGNASPNEYGIYRGNKKIGGEREEDVYRLVKMATIPPELREDRGEIEAALARNLPKLIEMDDLRGDLHAHTNYSDGRSTIQEMAAGALLAINSDAHSSAQLEQIRLGVFQARRGWVRPESVVNTWPWVKLKAWLKKCRERK
jgi:hypothetical protein